MPIVTVANFDLMTDALNSLINTIPLFALSVGASFALRFIEDVLGIHT